MAKVAIKGIKGKPQLYHAVYDFSVDGGAFGGGNEIDLFSLSPNSITHDMWFEVEEAVTSAGAATLEVGITGGDTDAYLKQLAKAAYSLDYISDGDDKGANLWDDVNKFSLRSKVSAATVISLLIGTAALTAGKVHYYILVSDGY